MNTERMLRLVEHLEQLPPESPFDMGTWSQYAREPYDTVPPQLECGTAGCALGYATQIPEFFATGLHLNNGGIPQFGNRTGYGAAELLMGIDEGESGWCFDPAAYGVEDDATPKRVATRLREVVAEYQAEQGEQK